MKNNLFNIFKKLLKDASGNIMIMGGIMMPVIALATMTAIDISQKYSIRGKMQSSLDAALLSATLEAQKLPQDSTPEQTQALLEAEFESFYEANFSNLMYKDDSFTLNDDDYTLTYDAETNKITAQVDFDHDGTASRLTNSYESGIAVSSTTSMTVVEDHYIIDLVMCLDATGSMQATLDAVKVAAQSFNTDLRAELSIPEDNLKIRVRSMFYRDWDDEYYFQNQSQIPSYWWPYINSKGGIQMWEGGLVHYPTGDGFIDLDPSDESGIDPNTQAANFTNFIGSEMAIGGFNWPEAAGACLNDGIRSSWFDNQSQEARDYFDIPDEQTIINIHETAPSGEYSRITTIPVIVFWTDATINSLHLSRTWISPTTPTSYSAFEQIWKNANYIDQNLKLMIHFGPNTGQGWNNVKTWDRYKFGGSLNVGNSDGVARIAEEISDAVPDILRVSG